MRRHLVPAAALALIATASLAGCKPQAATATEAASTATTGAPAASGSAAAPSCVVHYSYGTGITAGHGKVAGTADLACNGTPQIAMVSLTLAYIPPGASPSNDQGVAGQGFYATQPGYAVGAPCKPGSYALHVLYSATVNGTLLTDEKWGGTQTVTAAECGA